jgi:D-glycerate 3-kinase
MLTDTQTKDFVAEHRLPAGFAELIDAYYAPLAAWVIQMKHSDEAMLLGLNGAQGTGKSTLAAFLRMALKSVAGWQVAVLSIDDFYLTRVERQRLAEQVHSLLRTRGVPGTHDIQMLSDYLAKLKNLDPDTTLRVPSFDKARDDRTDEANWPTVTGPVDLVILEGWCVGSEPQADDELQDPVNSLEENEDTGGEWRAYVNEALKGTYAQLFAQLDALVYLRAPGFDAVYRWRLEQEEKLAACAPEHGSEIMNHEQIAHFVQHFERITRSDFAVLPNSAEVVLELDDNHDCKRVSGLTGNGRCINKPVRG